MRIITLITLILLGNHLIFSQSQKNLTRLGIDETSNIPRGLNTGSKAPDFTANTANGESITLSKELTKGNVVIIFYRGEWCPVCNRYLSNFQDSLKYITEKDAMVLAVTPEKISSAKNMKEKTGATFTIISDADESIMKNYDVAFDVTDAYQQKILTRLETDIAANNDKSEARLPVPATFIINKKGVIIYKQFDPDYHKRATVREILANLPK